MTSTVTQNTDPGVTVIVLIAHQLAIVKQVTGKLGITRKRIGENKTHHFLVCKSKPCLH